jgi:hypothetical protein
VAWHAQRLFEPGTTRLYVYADHGYRLYLDGNLLVDQWHDGRGEDHSLVTPLTEGLHRVAIEYYEGSGEAEIRFW